MRTSNTGHPPSNLESKAHRHLDVGRSVFDVRCSPRAFTLIELPAVGQRGFTLIELPAMRERGFTLIELLVVVTIIVVLLALLVPAMDKAIKEAELAMCGANLKAMSTAVIVYAGEYKRHYPYRLLAENAGVKASHIYNNSQYDDRELLRNYFGINATLNDPLTAPVNYDGSKPNTVVEVSYALWFGWRFRETVHAGAGMNKIGDRFVFNEDAGTNAGLHRFNILASDRDVISFTNNFSHGSHPDRDGKMQNITYQDQSIVTGVPGEAGSFANAQVTISRWDISGDYRRGALDLNYAIDDGSVVRHTGIEITNDLRVVTDRGIEMIGTDEFNNDFAAGSDLYLPPVSR